MKLELSSEWYEREFQIEAASPAMSITGGVACLDRFSQTLDERPPVLQTRMIPSFGRLINYARRSRGMTLAQLSHEADVELQVLAKMEREELCPNASIVSSLSLALSLPASRLISMYRLTFVEDLCVRENIQCYLDAPDTCDELGDDEQAVLDEFLELFQELST